MERNRWETAVRCLEVAVHPNTRDDEIIAAVNGFRRTADGTPMSQVCIEFACGGVPLADLADMKDALERLNRENRELRRKLAIEEAAQSGTARRLDAAFHRIHELGEALAIAQHQAATAEQEFAEFRAAQGRRADGASHDKLALLSALDEARRSATPAPPAAPSFARFLAEARLNGGATAPYLNGNGSGRLPPADPGADHPWTA